MTTSQEFHFTNCSPYNPTTYTIQHGWFQLWHAKHFSLGWVHASHCTTAGEWEWCLPKPSSQVILGAGGVLQSYPFPLPRWQCQKSYCCIVRVRINKRSVPVKRRCVLLLSCKHPQYGGIYWDLFAGTLSVHMLRAFVGACLCAKLLGSFVGACLCVHMLGRRLEFSRTQSTLLLPYSTLSCSVPFTSTLSQLPSCFTCIGNSGWLPSHSNI